MFMNDVYKKEEIRNVAISDLRNRGIKYRPKKIKNVQVRLCFTFIPFGLLFFVCDLF